MAARQRTRGTPSVDGYSPRKMALMSNLAMPCVADQMLANRPSPPASKDLRRPGTGGESISV